MIARHQTEWTKKYFFSGGGYHNDVDVHNTYNTYNETNNITQTDNSTTNVDSKSHS